MSVYLTNYFTPIYAYALQPFKLSSVKDKKNGITLKAGAKPNYTQENDRIRASE